MRPHAPAPTPHRATADRPTQPAAELRVVYESMSSRIDVRDWWPADSRFEVMVGAVLVQQTKGENAARSIERLATHALLTPGALASADVELVRECITPSGFMTAKVRACQAMARWVVARDVRESTLPGVGDDELRTELLALPGVGPETADVIMLYAFDRSVFVADVYARRLFDAIGLPAPSGYEALRLVGERLCVDAQFDVGEQKALHALIDEYGKRVRSREFAYTELPLRPVVSGSRPRASEV